MLKLLRKKGVAKKFLWFILVVITLSFGVFWQGNLFSNSNPASYAGKIFGKRIAVEEFQKNFRYTQIQAIIRYGDNFNKIKPYLNLEAETWDRLILLQEAKKRRIKISDEDVIKAIEEYPFFQRNSEFDTLLYNDILKYVFRIKPREFEEGIRSELQLRELFEQATSDVTVSDDYVYNEYKKKNEKVKVSYLLFPSEEHKNQAVVDPAQAQKYYQDNPEEFRLPATINVEYVSLDYPADATEEQKEAVAVKAQQFYADLTSDQNLASVAQKNNLPVQTSGFFSMEKPNLKIGWSYQILQKIFQLKTGEFMGPVQNPQGYQVLRLKEKVESYIPSYQDAQKAITDKLVLVEAKKLAQQKAQEILKQIQNAFDQVRNPNFIETARSLGLDVQQTAPFSQGEYIPQIGVSKEFQEIALSLTEEQPLSNVIEVANGYTILFLDERLGIDQAQYEKEKEQFAKTLFSQRRDDTFNEFLSRMRLMANLEDNISKNTKPPAPDTNS